MFKNVSLRKRLVDGNPVWILLGPDGKPVPAFSAFVKTMRKNKKNTLDSYARHIAEFLDYLYEVCILHEGEITKLTLIDAIESYADYLQLGVDATRDIARKIAEQIQPGANSTGSIVPKVSAVRRFLKLNDVARKEMIEIEKYLGENNNVTDRNPLLPGLGQRRELGSYEVLAMQANSMFAGVIAGGPKLIDSIILNGVVNSIPYEENRAFPYDKVIDLIECLPTYRDKAFYAFLAASGCRTNECLQLLIEDVDVTEGSVKLVDPELRPGISSYRFLSAEQRSSLAWKGRTTQLTFLIEPFASIFFLNLKQYLDHEHIYHGKHDFLFQYISGEERGMPFFLSAASTRLEPFHKACAQIGVRLPMGTAGHSLRHMYGTYLINYFPRANGEYGLPPSMVQQFMGHHSLKSTLKYARYDKDLQKLELENANKVIFSAGAPKKLHELKIEALEFQLKNLKDKISRGEV